MHIFADGRVKYLKDSSIFQGQANNKVESLLHMQEFRKHLKAMFEFGI